jgi:hypothetical protein
MKSAPFTASETEVVAVWRESNFIREVTDAMDRFEVNSSHFSWFLR